VGCGEGAPPDPSPTGEGVSEGAVPLPQKNLAFLASKSHVCDAL